MVELDDDVFAAVRGMADRTGTPVGDLLSVIVARATLESSGVTEEFVDDVRDMVATYRPVLRRLAQ